ncbi:uncharacterized protein LOC5568042 isoform X2 [Aedes aegypti]|nr:uncharacterized protein LOC5568042 isoform X2 [Aedes aegypti]XP_021706753.1 uncharacterized protein LOC5568042 isoform X2 [Aedes aegypti]
MYELTVDSFEPDPNIDKDYIVLNTLRVTRKQRNVYAIVGSFETFQNWGNQNIVYYTISSADKPGPPIMSGKAGFCDVFNMKHEIVEKVREASDMPPICPLPKGVYNIKNFELTEKMLPPMMPQGQYVVHAKMNNHEGKQVLAYKVFATVK